MTMRWKGIYANIKTRTLVYSLLRVDHNPRVRENIMDELTARVTQHMVLVGCSLTGLWGGE